jgi:hypothetical protein
MAGILKRTVFYELTKDLTAMTWTDTDGNTIADHTRKMHVRFMDWALVKTGLGMMLEPHMPNQRTGIDAVNKISFGATAAADTATWDYTDMIAMINEMRQHDADSFSRHFHAKDTGERLHILSNQVTRVGR